MSDHYQYYYCDDYDDDLRSAPENNNRSASTNNNNNNNNNTVRWDDSTFVPVDERQSTTTFAHDEEPSPPLEFPVPRIRRGTVRRSVRVYDPKTNTEREHRSVLLRNDDDDDDDDNGRSRFRQQPRTAYSIAERIGDTVHGSVRLCRVLKRRRRRRSRRSRDNRDERYDHNDHDHHDHDNDDNEDGRYGWYWVETDRTVVLKTAAWSRIRRFRGRAENYYVNDPLREVAALQLLGDYHAHVGGLADALEDDANLYVVVPFCADGSLRDVVVASHLRGNNTGNDYDSDDREARARVWFRQLLLGLQHLQMKGVCHGALSLETIGVHEGGLVLSEFGRSLRVPYSDPVNEGCRACVDVSEGGATARRPIRRAATTIDPRYAAPELLHNASFDGHAVDLWAAGVVLYAALFGSFPFVGGGRRSSNDNDDDRKGDDAYRRPFADGGALSERRDDDDDANGNGNGNVKVSDGARDLLRSMFRTDPTQRPSLLRVMEHPWVRNNDNNNVAGAASKTGPASAKKSRKRDWYYGVLKRKRRARVSV